MTSWPGCRTPTPEEAAARLGGLPDGVRVECYRADGATTPTRSAEAQFYVIPYMHGEETLSCAGEMTACGWSRR